MKVTSDSASVVIIAAVTTARETKLKVQNISTINAIKRTILTLGSVLWITPFPGINCPRATSLIIAYPPF